MFEHIKKRIIKGLIGEIGCLDPVSLELVGHNVIAIIENKKMIHHGINKDYKPSGYTVDSFSNDSTVVGEYSTEKSYFEDKGTKENPCFEKISNDIAHAIEHKKPEGPDKIYLITNQEEPPSFRSKFNLTECARSYGQRAIIIDARELARTVYDQSIANPEVADYYKAFFPGFSQDLDNYEYYGKVPAQCERYVHDSGILNAITRHYDQGNTICVLYGVSGSGKTQAAIDFIHHEGKNFENFIWISGEDWKPDTTLSAVRRTRGGIPINVGGLFNSAKTILVIDSIERAVERSHFTELTSGFNKGGVVLATSQISTPESPLYLAIPTLSNEVAVQILGEDPASTTKNCGEFVKTCSFLPLILSTTRNIVEIEGISRSDFYKEILSAPEEISGPDGASIMRRILAKLEPGAREALGKIANSGSSVHDIAFLRHFIGINACLNLQRRSILMPANIPGVMKVHDLVCLATQSDLCGIELAEAIEKYIGNRNGEMTPSVLREIHLSYSQLYDEHIRRGDRDPDWLSYALLQVEGEVKNDIHEQIYAKEITPDLNIASVMCIIDAKEVHSYTIENSDERKIYYKRCAEALKKAFDESSCNDVKAELLHHHAKALRRCGKYEEALASFMQLLNLKPEWHVTHGQIAHLGSQYGVDSKVKEKGEESMRALLEFIMQDASSVPLRVSLAALARLRSYQNIVKEVSSRPDDIAKLADIIAMSAIEGFGQFYEAFVSFTSIFGYHHSSTCVALAETFPEVLTIPPELVVKKQWVSACEALTNIAISAGRAGKTDLVHRISEASIKFANAVSSKEKLEPYDARAVAKAYIANNIPQKALDAVAKVSDDRIDHWLLYRKSEAQLAIGDHEGALESSRNAFDLAEKDKKVQSRISIYHDLLCRCYEACGDNSAALAEAKLALNKCKDDQYRKTLEARVVSLAT